MTVSIQCMHPACSVSKNAATNKVLSIHVDLLVITVHVVFFSHDVLHKGTICMLAAHVCMRIGC